ncbi:MAG: hypothetical protein LQ343_000533 [Gyalolechia ehrenbergii]|nr:MAG: hypothetical protein LQ343_000533 [Gyalolechia ehrenbergii]
MTPLLINFPRLPSTATSIPHADSSLSSNLISALAVVLPRSPALTISVGYGHGLLEAYLVQSNPTLDIVGVDVVYLSPQFIPKAKTRIIPGTYTTSREALMAEAWLFVYPKDLALLGKYVREYGGGKVRTIIWIGPRMDCEDVKKGVPSEGWEMEALGEHALKDYEALAIWKKIELVNI